VAWVTAVVQVPSLAQELLHATILAKKKDPGKVREQMFAVEPIDMVVPCLSGLSSPGD